MNRVPNNRVQRACRAHAPASQQSSILPGWRSYTYCKFNLQYVSSTCTTDASILGDVMARQTGKRFPFEAILVLAALALAALAALAKVFGAS